MLKKILNPIDDYSKRMLRLIKKCKTNSEIIAVIDKIYADGFYDGSTNP